MKANLQKILSAKRPNMDLFSPVDALNSHMKGEEDYLYLRLEDNPTTRQMAFASYEEYNIVKGLISNMGMATDNDRWMAKVRVLYTVIDAHIDVEEKQVFLRAKDLLYDQTEREIRNQYIGHRTPTVR